MASQKSIFPMKFKFVLTNYLQLLLYISQEQSVTAVKGLTCSNYKVKVNMNIVYVADCFIN